MNFSSRTRRYRYTLSMRIILCSLLFCCLQVATAAESSPQSQRGEFRAALTQVERGVALDPAKLAALANHPLLPWLQYAELRKSLGRSDDAQMTKMLARHRDMPFVDALRLAWMRELAKRRDWTAFLRHYRAADDDRDVGLRCLWFDAQLATVRWSDELADAIADMWRHGDSRPASCDAAFAALARHGGLDAKLRWQRLDLAAEQGNTGLMRFIARDLPAAQKQRAETFADFIDQPSAPPLLSAPEPRSAAIASIGLARLARRDPSAAESLLVTLKPLGMTPTQEARVRYQIALWTAASYLPGAAQRFAAVPAEAYDESLHGWRVREALARSDWKAAKAALEKMPPELAADPRWRYLLLRMRDIQGEAAPAAAGFAELAKEANYFGFLSADRIGAPYALCPLEASPTDAQKRQVDDSGALVRALELRALDRLGWAELEWRTMMATLEPEAQRYAISRAVDARWYDRAVFGLSSADNLSYYSLRFPLAQRATLREETRRHQLDDAWVAALIRAESAWQPHARSHADARGLMQLLPATGKSMARQLKLPWNGAKTLYQARANIALGTAYLASMLSRYGGQPYLATAAYNAGPAPISRWLAQRPGHDVDLWIETIPYRETREYVARIMAFSVIYDWRLHGKATPMSARMRGELTNTRRTFACPSIDPAATSS